MINGQHDIKYLISLWKWINVLNFVSTKIILGRTLIKIKYHEREIERFPELDIFYFNSKFVRVSSRTYFYEHSQFLISGTLVSRLPGVRGIPIVLARCWTDDAAVCTLSCSIHTLFALLHAIQNLSAQLRESPIKRKIKTIRLLTSVGNNGTSNIRRFVIWRTISGLEQWLTRDRVLPLVDDSND